MSNIYNLNYIYIEFHGFFKENPALLNEILSQDKYGFKNKGTEEHDEDELNEMIKLNRLLHHHFIKAIMKKFKKCFDFYLKCSGF